MALSVTMAGCHASRKAAMHRTHVQQRPARQCILHATSHYRKFPTKSRISLIVVGQTGSVADQLANPFHVMRNAKLVLVIGSPEVGQIYR